MTQKQQDDKPLWLRQAPITIAGVLLLGVVASTLYDLLVKPGLSTFGRFLLNLVTLGSKSLQDAAYSSAALDPTPVSALMILASGLALATLPATRMLRRGRKSAERELDKQLSQCDSADQRKEILELHLGKIERKLSKLKLAFFLIFVPWWLGLLVAFMVHNQSVMIWRTFHANMAILSPKLSANESNQLMAEFAAVDNRDDYLLVRQKMQALAASRGAKLRDIQTW